MFWQINSKMKENFRNMLSKSSKSRKQTEGKISGRENQENI
jgi:hypothetical protein